MPSKADINKLVKLKYYQDHDEFIPTTNASVLDPDANCLDLSLSGSHPVKVSSLQALEGQSRDMIRILSHAEIFSFAAFKCLQSENMDSRVLMEILKSMSMAITDAMSIIQTLGLQQMRREAAIESAFKGSLTSEAKRKLRLAPFTSKLLFDGQIGAIYKENVAENHEILVKKAVTNQAKPNPSSASSSSRKPKAKSGKNKTKSQETPKKDFPFPSSRPPRRGPSFRGSSSRGRGAGPSRGGASTSRETLKFNLHCLFQKFRWEEDWPTLPKIGQTLQATNGSFL